VSECDETGVIFKDRNAPGTKRARIGRQSVLILDIETLVYLRTTCRAAAAGICGRFRGEG